uniref:Ribosomal protein S6 kinase delta-1 n=1 Tax=Anopheles epiroticus TaxID=199890 RepID=A0A182PC35_9DIPT
MLLVGRRKAETWVHSFSVGNETRKYKGFTIYRITSIVFPRSHPEGLTRVTLWKRFSEVKKLYKELVRRHRERHLPGAVPSLADPSYFNRFDPVVIEERKRYILKLLEFAGQEPLLYRSHAFLNFFTRGIVVPEGHSEEEVSEVGVLSGKQNGKSDGGGNIEAIRKQLGIGQQDELSLIDPTRDQVDGQGNGTSTDGSCTSGGEDVDEVDTTDGVGASVTPVAPCSGSLTDSMISDTVSYLSEQSTAICTGGTMPTEELPPVDYLVAAGMVFSKAVEAEANGDYQRAFEQYKAGIDRLLSGAKDDTNATRRKIAKEKSCKYVAKAEEIYDRFLEQQSMDSNAAEERFMGPLSFDEPSSPIQLLERPLNYLSRYKVVKVIGTVMQVQDVTDKKFYIMKSIRRPPAHSGSGTLPFSSAAVFPQDVPYMVPLIAYFQATDGGIFLLLRLVCAGKLWDFIRSYQKPASYCPSPDKDDCYLVEAEREGESKPAACAGENGNGAQQGDPNCSGYDSGFLDLVNEYSNGGGVGDEKSESHSPNACDQQHDEVAIEVLPDEPGQEQNENQDKPELVIPSFDALSKDMDVRELLSCSQRLLKAVSQTLEETDEHSNASVAIAADVISSLESVTTVVEGQEENRKSHSSQLGLARMSSISEPLAAVAEVNEVTPDLLPEGSVRRWISELVIAIDSLHFNGIVCGDLTMDNLLLGAEGQLMLTYFHRRGESYFSQPGGHPVAPKQTAIRELYVAPERPLEPKSDFWSIGVIMFEMLTKRKFVLCHPSGVFCYHEVQYPEGVELSVEARQLLEGLLQPDVERRLDFKQIIASAFFRTVDWSEVKRRGISSSQ